MEKWRFLKIYFIQIIGFVCVVFAQDGQLSRDKHKDPYQINRRVGLGGNNADSHFLPNVLWKILHNEKTIDSFLKRLSSLEFASNSSKLESYNGMLNLLKKFSVKYNSTSEIHEVSATFKPDSMLLSNRCRSALDDLFKLLIEGKYLKIEQCELSIPTLRFEKFGNGRLIMAVNSRQGPNPKHFHFKSQRS